MFIAFAILLLVLWALGFFAFHVTTAMVHVLLFLAVAAVIVHFVRFAGSRQAA